jgi:sugar lactone lactonase YvrE
MKGRAGVSLGALLLAFAPTIAACGADRGITSHDASADGSPASSEGPMTEASDASTDGDAPSGSTAPADGPSHDADGPIAERPDATDIAETDSAAAPGPEAGVGRPTLFWLDINHDQVWRANSDGSGAHVIASGGGISAPDGIALDPAVGRVFWTNMGSINGGGNNASIQSTGLDGGPVETLVRPGSGVNTAKQMTIDRMNRKLYFCDREGAKVWRASYDGSALEMLASASAAPHHDFQQLVGIALDQLEGKIYFTDKNAQRIRRMGLTMPAGEGPATRGDIEELVAAGVRSAPIDLRLDLAARTMYWTDRSLGIVQRAGMDLPAGRDASTRDDVEVVAAELADVIGITMDGTNLELYVTQSDGTITTFHRDGSGRRVIGHTGSTGIAFEVLP